MTAVDLECESVSTSAMRSDASECSTPPASPEASIQQSNRKRRRGADDDEARKQRLAERKKRNRESAERSRQRKLQYYKDLEISVVDLRKENEELRTKLASHQDLQREVEQLRAQLAAAKSDTPSSFSSSPATPASSSTSVASPPASPKAQCSETDHAELAKSIESTLDEVLSNLSSSVTPTRVSVEPSADDSFVDADILGAILNDDIDMDMDTDKTEHASSTARAQTSSSPTAAPLTTELESDEIPLLKDLFATPESAVFICGASIDSYMNSTLVPAFSLQLDRKQMTLFLRIFSTQTLTLAQSSELTTTSSCKCTYLSSVSHHSRAILEFLGPFTPSCMRLARRPPQHDPACQPFGYPKGE